MVYNQVVMKMPDTTITVPLTVTEQGAIRIANSRVSLDSVIYQFKLGAVPEQIVYSFPSLSLDEIYLAIAYYLTHREAVEEYLREQEAEAEILRQRIESDPKHQKRMSELRERLLARKIAQQQDLSPVNTD